MSSQRIRTAQGEINWVSDLNRRKRFSGFWKPEFGVQMPGCSRQEAVEQLTETLIFFELTELLH